MGTVLIVWQYGGNLGHVGRLLPIAATLRSRGFRVVFAVRDPEAARRYLQPARYAWCIGPQAPRLTLSAQAPVNQDEILLRMGFAQPRGALACVEQWVRLFAKLQPDAVLVDESPLALYAAKSAAVPCLVIGHGFELPVLERRPCLTPWVEGAQHACIGLEQQLQTSLQHMARCISTRTRGHAPTSLRELFDPGTAVLCTWPELDHFDRVGQSARYSGPIWGEIEPAAVVEWPDRPGKKVLCYLNLEDKKHDLMWQSLAQHHGANVLVISPSGVPKACEAARGWGITVLEQPCMLAPLLARCDVVVGHGGMGFTSMALQAAKPLLLLPQQMEQMVLAYRLSRQGLALATRRGDVIHTRLVRLRLDAWEPQLAMNAKRTDGGGLVADDVPHSVLTPKFSKTSCTHCNSDRVNFLIDQLQPLHE